MKKLFPTPPAPQNTVRRFKFFTGPHGKRYPEQTIVTEMARFAWTPEGMKLFSSINRKTPKFPGAPIAGRK